jgi:hypothetical protein
MIINPSEKQSNDRLPTMPGFSTVMNPFQDELSSTGESFGWSDFPLLRHSLEEKTPATCLSTVHSPTSSVDFDDSCATNMSLDSDRSDFDSSPPSSLVASNKSESFSMATPKKKRVSFSKIEIRNYRVILGDHSDPEDGLPLSLAWEYNPSTTTLTVDQHEGLRQHLRATSTLSRRQSVPKLSYLERKNRLRIINGYSESFLMHLEVTRLLKEELELEDHHWL